CLPGRSSADSKMALSFGRSSSGTPSTFRRAQPASSLLGIGGCIHDEGFVDFERGGLAGGADEDADGGVSRQGRAGRERKAGFAARWNADLADVDAVAV